MFKFKDSHAHIHNIKGDLKTNLLEVEENGIDSVVNLFSFKDEFIKTSNETKYQLDHCIKLQKECFSRKFLKLALGVHPIEIDEIIKFYTTIEPQIKIQNILEYCEKYIKEKMEYIDAIGETGLDMKLSPENIELQLEFLRMHAYLAEKYNKVLVIHARNCKVTDILNEINKNIKFIFHCFSFSTEELIKIIRAGGYISFSGIVTFPKASYIYDACKACPMEHLLIETDSPYLSPIPVRGKENKPHYIKYTYEYIAELKKIPINSLIKSVDSNYNVMFSEI